MLAVKTMEQRMAVQLWPFRTLGWVFHLLHPRRDSGHRWAGQRRHSRRESPVPGVRRAHLDGRYTPRPRGRRAEGSAVLLAPGLVVGLMLAAAATRLTEAVFVGVNVLNPRMYLGVALAQVAVVIAAGIGPAVRVSHVDPLVALRTD
jgi:hypothetical protein